MRRLPRHVRHGTTCLLRSLSTLDKALPVENRSRDHSLANHSTGNRRLSNVPLNTPGIEVVRAPVKLDIEDILNKKQHISVNDTTQTGLFGVDTLDTGAGFQTYVENVIENCNSILREIEDTKRLECMECVELVDKMVEQVATLSNIALFIAQSTSDIRHEAKAALQRAEHYVEELNNNKLLFRALQNVVRDPASWKQLDGETQRVVSALLTDYRNSGVGQTQTQQSQIQLLNKQITESGVRFVKKSAEPVKIPIASCPEPLLGLPYQDNEIVVSEWCSDHTSDAVREHAWRYYHAHNTEREQALHNLLDKRQQLATATGYANYAARALHGSMAGSPAVVREFLQEIHTQVRPLARWEYFQFERAKLMDSKFWHNAGYFKLQEVVMFPWDPQYYSADMKKYYIKTETPNIYPNLPDFLSVGSVIEQCGVWFEDTFAVTLVAEIPRKGELWSKDVIKLGVEHETEGLLGFLYLDFLPVDQRRVPPCHHVIRSGAGKVVPISVIECDYKPGDGYRPPHLTMSSFEKLFTELGGAIHSMLSRTRYYQTSTNYMSRDTARVSNYLLQKIARHPALLYHVLKHHTRTRVLPRVDADKVVAMCNGMAVFNTHQLEHQLLYSSFDQLLHTDWSSNYGSSSTDLFARHVEEYTHMPYVENTAPHLRFTGLFTQGAQYYSHLWAQAIANILYEELFSADPFSRHAGEYFREHFLQHGAARNPREMVEYLTGTRLTPDRLATALVKPHELSQNFSAGYMRNWGEVGWSKEVSAESPLLARLADTHPHLLDTRTGQLLHPGKFREKTAPQLAT